MKSAEPTPEERDALIRAIAGLAEHFDVVQVLVSRHDPVANATTALSAGIGNTYARIGHAEDWLNDQQLADREPPPAAEGDEWKMN